MRFIPVKDRKAAEREYVLVEVSGDFLGTEKSVVLHEANLKQTIDFLNAQKAEIEKQIKFNEALLAGVRKAALTVELMPNDEIKLT